MKLTLMLLTIFLIGCTSFDQPIDSNQSVACQEDAKVCPDGSMVVRVGPNCEFEPCPNYKIKCTEEQKNAEYCITLEQPVCGWFNENIKCIKYPCAQTFSNNCFACMDENVESWTPNECPT